MTKPCHHRTLACYSPEAGSGSGAAAWRHKSCRALAGAVLAFATSAVCLVPAAARADAPAATPAALPMRVDVGIGSGFVSFSKDSGLGNAANPNDVPGAGPLFGLHAGGVILDGKLGIEAQMRTVLTTLRSGDATAKVFGWRLQGLWYLATDGTVLPYVTAGYGQEIMTNSKPQCPATGAPTAGCMYVKTPDADKAFLLGVGARVPVTYRLALRAQLAYLGADGRPKVSKVAGEFEGNVGISYSFGGAPEDSDKDGIPNDADKCPDKAEDKDGFADDDGCPEDDNDNDGILDAQDRCPNTAEDLDGFQDSDGCPDLDNDNDGVPDTKDKCPDKPETKNGYQDDDGCPDVADVDGDGILVPMDKCPNQAEDKDGFEDDDGCPELDNDRDGIMDAVDKCPNKPETKNNFQDEDGCPDQLAESVAKLFDRPLNTLEFKADKLNKGTEQQLTPLLEFMLEQEAVKISITVQTETADDAGKKLGLARADAVKAWLADQGIDAARITTTAGDVASAPAKPVKGVSKPLVMLKLL